MRGANPSSKNVTVGRNLVIDTELNVEGSLEASPPHPTQLNPRPMLATPSSPLANPRHTKNEEEVASREEMKRVALPLVLSTQAAARLGRVVGDETTGTARNITRNPFIVGGRARGSPGNDIDEENGKL